MNTALIKDAHEGDAIQETSPTQADPVALLLADKRSPATKRAYAADLNDFFGGTARPEDVRDFLSLSGHEVALRLATYKAALIERGLSEATINRRLAALRSLLKFSHRLGLARSDGRGLVDSEKSRAYRDTRGTDLQSLRRLLLLPEQLHGPGTERTLRDSALLRLLCENALRRAEVCALGVADFAFSERRLMVIGKGRGTQKAPITLSPRCADAVAAYLIAAGHASRPDAPLLRSLDRRPDHHGERLTSDGLYHLIDEYGRALGVPLTPHKLRHSAITAALDATGGDVRKVQKLSRHADLRTLTIYDDNRSDFQGEVTGLLSGLL
jgi:integrase/recombinase XerC